MTLMWRRQNCFSIQPLKYLMQMSLISWIVSYHVLRACWLGSNIHECIAIVENQFSIRVLKQRQMDFSPARVHKISMNPIFSGIFVAPDSCHFSSLTIFEYFADSVLFKIWCGYKKVTRIWFIWGDGIINLQEKKLLCPIDRRLHTCF